jgi:hypothetical protein
MTSNNLKVLGIFVISTLVALGFLLAVRQYTHGDFFTDMTNNLGIPLSGFSKYTDPSSKIGFQYPSDWTKIYELNLNNPAISLGSPTENNQRSIFTFSLENTDFIYLDTYKSSHESELKNLNVFGRGIEWIDGPFDTTLAGLPAFKIQYISPVLGGLDTIEIITMKDGKLYTASYQGKPQAFQKHLDSFNKILSTIKIG